MPPWTMPKQAWPGRPPGDVGRVRPPGPADRPAEGGLGRVPRRRVRQALVQGVEDVGPQGVLDLHDQLGGEQVLRAAVEVGAEAHPLLANGPEGGQAPHLDSRRSR